MGYTEAAIKSLKKGKSKEQISVIDYFTKEGCFSGIMKDEAYEALVQKRLNSFNLKDKALSKIGLDESEVSEIAPVYLEGYAYKDAFAKQKANGGWISSTYQASWIFFSDTQVYIYAMSFNMDDDKRNERTDEYFYKDITSFSTVTDNDKIKSKSDEDLYVESHTIKIIVPGDYIQSSIQGVENPEEIVQGMKQKLREKKNQ